MGKDYLQHLDQKVDTGRKEVTDYNQEATCFPLNSRWTALIRSRRKAGLLKQYSPTC